MAIDLLDQILPHIKNAIYTQRLQLPDWRMREGDIEGAHQPKFKDSSWLPIRIPFEWGKYDRTFWFRNHLALPPEYSGKRIVLLIDFPEALLYVNGEPYHGVDRNHDEVLLTDKARAHQEFALAVQAYSGRKREHNTFALAEIAVLDPTARGLYHGLNTLKALGATFDHGSQELKDIHELIRRTLVFLKYFKPEGEEYPNAISRAYNFLLMAVETEFPSSLPGLIYLIGQSHIDVVWLWTLQETIRKCGRTHSSALRLIEEMPEFRFVQSQAYLYALTREHYPHIYQQIRQRVAEGRWEPIGGMYVEPDCNIPAGESLVRQILFGRKFFKKEFGLDSTIAWLPDSFGFAASLPQILQKSGFKYFFTTKLSWNDTNKFPHTAFWWEGIDGTKILSYNPLVGLEGSISPNDVQKSGSPFADEESPLPAMQTFGYGDGGGGPTKQEIETFRVLRSVIGAPNSKLASPVEFFTQLESVASSLPSWKGELYLEKHRGVLTTHGWLKKANRESEAGLYTAEVLATLAAFAAKNLAQYPSDHLTEAWKKLLVNQFHDVLPGTCIADAYTMVRENFAELNAATSKVIANSMKAFAKPSKKNQKEFAFTLFNSLAWSRNEYVELSIHSKEEIFSVTNERGDPVPCQVVARNKGTVTLLCYAETISPLGSTTLIVQPAPQAVESDEHWKVSSHSVETVFYKVRFDNKGSISSLYDKKHRRDLVQRGKRANALQAFRDTPKQWEAWDIDADYERHKLDILHSKGFKVVEQGPLRLTLRFEYRTESGSTIAQLVRFYHKSSRIDFVTDVNWKERQVLLKSSFALHVKTSNATYDIPFGAIQRTTKPKDDREKAKFEVPAQQWADLSETKFGISLVNDGKYGYDAKENVLRLTLLRSPHYPHPIEPWSQFDNAVTDQGTQHFTYSMHPHSGTWSIGETVQRAKELNTPLVILPDHVGIATTPFVGLSKPNIMIDCLKKAEDSDAVVIRLHEAFGETVETTVRLAHQPRAVMECDLMENELRPIKPSKGKFTLRFKPFEIKTIKLSFKPGR